MGQSLTLVGVGDSWTWGTELLDPTTVGPIWDFSLHHLPINQEYRLRNRYLKLFADKIGADNIVDLSFGGCSNDTIVRNLIRWLTEQDYMSGRNTDNLFVSIGWTSPERKDFWFNHKIDGHPDNWLTMRPIHYHNLGYQQLKDFFDIYVENFWNHNEYMHRWINQIWQLEVILKSFKIKYVMHQAFYDHHGKGVNEWNDSVHIDDRKTINLQDQKLWNIIDTIRFMNKNNPEIGTFYNYITNAVGQNKLNTVIGSAHPTALGHSIWANHMYDYCIENKLI